MPGERCDHAGPVLVVGAGPGGSATALSLAARGVQVVLLDRATFPRDKVCGDVVLPGAQDALHQLGVDTQALQAQAYLCTGSRYVATGGRQIAGTFVNRDGKATPWWMVKRRTLDAFLLEEARKKGADVREGHQVMRLLRERNGQVTGLVSRGPDGIERELHGRAVVGADGASSIVARELGLPAVEAQHLCLAGRTYVEGLRLPAPYLEIFTTARTLPGCAWAVPVAPDVANVGIGIIRSDATRRGVTPQQLFDEVTIAVPLLAERLRGHTLEPLRGWSLPGASSRRPIHGAGWLLVGDAGAMIDVFTGHGIHTALKAGAIAGDVLAAAIARNDLSAAALASYTARCNAEFLDEAAHGRRLQQLHRSPLVMRTLVRACDSFGSLRQLFLGLLGHAQPRHSLLSVPGLVRGLSRLARPASVGE